MQSEPNLTKYHTTIVSFCTIQNTQYVKVVFLFFILREAYNLDIT